MQYYFLVSFVDEIFDRKWKMEDVRWKMDDGRGPLTFNP